MRQKLQNTNGETLVEVLASILVCSLSVLLLFSAVGASSSISLTAQASDRQYYEDLSKAERQSAADACSPPPTAALTVTSASETVHLGAGKITFYGTERLLSYAVPGGGP